MRIQGALVILLISGVVLWSTAHFLPSLARPVRQGLIDRLGDGPYRGVFSLLVVTALVLIVVGWRSTPEEYVYVLPVWSRTVGLLLMIVSFVLIGAAQYKTAIKRLVRHPMLTGVFIWSGSHLLMNGTTRAIVLFGGLGFWALLEIILINAREGAYTKPEAPGMKSEIRGLVISGVILVIAVFLHPYFAGVAVLPR